MYRVVLMTAAVAMLALSGCDEAKVTAAKLIANGGTQAATGAGDCLQLMLQDQVQQQLRDGSCDGSGDGNNYNYYYNHNYNYGGSDGVDSLGVGDRDRLRLRDGSCQD